MEKLNEIDVNKAIEITSSILTAIFSWIVILGISVIVAGKLMCRMAARSISSDDRFVINFFVFRISAKGDEVLFGFLIFLLVLLAVIFFGGRSAYEMFRDHSGIDIGQWNSICVLASLLSVMIASLIFLLNSIDGPPGGAPIITEEERKEQIAKLNKKSPNE
jgi:hypothetical protein